MKGQSGTHSDMQVRLERRVAEWEREAADLDCLGLHGEANVLRACSKDVYLDLVEAQREGAR